MKGKIFLSLFALPFFGTGLWMLWSVSGTFLDAWQMQNWVQTEAQLRRAGYESHSGEDSDTYKAYAEFTYKWQGQTFVADRVSISGEADNIGDFQRDLGNRLSAALARGQSITVFVDPDEPSDAIIDRSIRWGLIGFKSIFLFVFGGVGFGLLILAFRTSKEKDKTDPRYNNAPWLLDDNWQTASIRSSSRASMLAVWGFAAFWNLISAPLPFVMYDEVVNKQNYIALVGSLFSVVGIGMLVWAIRRTLEWKRFGATPVLLDPFPGSIGGHVGGTIELGLPFDPANDFRLTLTNIHSYVSGSGKDRSKREKAAWQDSVIAHAEPVSKGTRLTFRFDVPDGLNSSDTDRDDSYYLWRLDLSAELDGTDIDRSYDIPVYATATESRHLSKLAVERAREKQDAVTDRDVLNVMHLSQDASGRSMRYPIGRHVGTSLGAFLVGAAFTAVGWWLITNEGHTLFGSVFGGIGALVGVVALYMMINSLEVSRDGNDIRTVRRILGIPVQRRSMSRNAFVKFTKESSFQSQGGGKHVMYYSIYANDIEGQKLRVGEGFKGESEARAAIRLISRELGLASTDTPADKFRSGKAWDPAGLLRTSNEPGV